MGVVYYPQVCSDLRYLATRLNETAISYFTPFRPMLGQRAGIDQVGVASYYVLVINTS